jgi:hypothetical protein
MNTLLSVGQRVRFSDKFIGTLNEPETLKDLRGEIVNIREFGFPGHMMQLIDVAWDSEDEIGQCGGGDLVLSFEES